MSRPHALRKVKNSECIKKGWIQLISIVSQPRLNSSSPVCPASLGGSGPASADINMLSYASVIFFQNGILSVECHSMLYIFFVRTLWYCIWVGSCVQGQDSRLKMRTFLKPDSLGYRQWLCTTTVYSMILYLSRWLCTAAVYSMILYLSRWLCTAAVYSTAGDVLLPSPQKRTEEDPPVCTHRLVT